MTLHELLERVEKAEGPDREIDADLFIATTPECQVAGRVDKLGGVVGWWPKDGPYQSAREVARCTASVDAALALVERAYPGRRVAMERGESYASARFVRGWGGRRETGPASERPDNELPLAILAALLRALIAKEIS